jgi:hypothetical protein
MFPEKASVLDYFRKKPDPKAKTIRLHYPFPHDPLANLRYQE